jgi:hypothetical protein
LLFWLRVEGSKYLHIFALLKNKNSKNEKQKD